MKPLTLKLTILVTISFVNTGLSELTMLTSCTCTGYEVAFECVVSGNGSTTWRGTALEECAGGRIILRHSEFENENGYMISKTCGNSGLITGQAASVVNDIYVSQLIINVSQQLNGSTIECVSGSTNNSRLISLTSQRNAESISPPNNIIISDINRQHITFNFETSSSLQNCPAVQYNIVSENCGNCPNITLSNSFTCSLESDAFTEPHECSVTMKTLLCGSIFGRTNQSTTFLVEAIQSDGIALNISVFYEYNIKKTSIKRIFLEFSVSDFIIDDSESLLNTTIFYVKFIGGDKSCGLIALPATSCTAGTCKFTFDISSSMCINLTTINIIVMATNIQGNNSTHQIVISRPASDRFNHLTTAPNTAFDGNDSQTNHSEVDTFVIITFVIAVVIILLLIGIIVGLIFVIKMKYLTKTTGATSLLTLLLYSREQRDVCSAMLQGSITLQSTKTSEQTHQEVIYAEIAEIPFESAAVLVNDIVAYAEIK